MKLILQILAVVLVAIVIFLAGAFWGYQKGEFQAALEENKVAAACLRAEDLIVSGEFREYLKGRIYYNLASTYPNDRGYLLRRDWDFGPVDVALLKRRIYAKDPGFPCESFDSATSSLSRAEHLAPPNERRQNQE